jgi:hypothetical protein
MHRGLVTTDNDKYNNLYLAIRYEAKLINIAFPTISESTDFFALCNHQTVWVDKTFGHRDDLLASRLDSYSLGVSLVMLWKAGHVRLDLVEPLLHGLLQWDPRKRATPREALFMLVQPPRGARPPSHHRRLQYSTSKSAPKSTRKASSARTHLEK